MKRKQILNKFEKEQIMYHKTRLDWYKKYDILRLDYLSHLFLFYKTLKNFPCKEFLAIYEEYWDIMKKIREFDEVYKNKSELNMTEMMVLKELIDNRFQIADKMDNLLYSQSPEMKQLMKKKQWICQNCGRQNWIDLLTMVPKPFQNVCSGCGEKPKAKKKNKKWENNK